MKNNLIVFLNENLIKRYLGISIDLKIVVRKVDLPLKIDK